MKSAILHTCTFTLLLATTIAQPQQPTPPLIITVIPHHGFYPGIDDAVIILNIAPDSSNIRLRSNLSLLHHPLFTADSGSILFISPDINRSNAANYQYRVLLNADSVIEPWQDILHFTDTLFTSGNLKKGMAFFGSFKTTWDNYLRLELKVKNSPDILSAAEVYWKPVKPVLLNIYTTDDLQSFLNTQINSQEYPKTRTGPGKWKPLYKPEDLDSNTGLPKKLKLKPDQNNVVFSFRGNFKEEALEYQLLKNGRTYSQWQPSKAGGNFIWLKKLTPGDYQLQMRYALQRHNIMSYPFSIDGEWFQSPLVKIGGTTFLLFIVALLYWSGRQKSMLRKEIAEREKLNLELKIITTQLNPHFVGNALSSIQDLVYKNDRDSALRYLAEFNRLLNRTLENNDQEYVTLNEDLAMLKSYIKLEQLRFGFKYHFVIDKRLDKNSVEVPFLLLQPLVENAIKHGAGPKNEAGILVLSYAINQENLEIEIADNGDGFTNTSLTKGHGLSLVQQRINLLNKNLSDQRIHLSFDKRINTQTIVQLTFQNWL